jgi:hypothetical protein
MDEEKYLQVNSNKICEEKNRRGEEVGKEKNKYNYKTKT